MSKFLYTCLLLFSLAWSHMAMAERCSVQVTALPFATYTTLQPTSKTVSSPINIQCTTNPADEKKGVFAQLGLSLGQNANGSVLQRSMSNGQDRLYYNVYKDAGFQTIFGDGNGQGSTFSVCLDSQVCGNSPTNTTQPDLTLTMYGAIPPKQDVTPGSYTDSLLLTIAF